MNQNGCIPCEIEIKKKQDVYKRARQFIKDNNIHEVAIVKTKNGFLSFREIGKVGQLKIVEYLYE